jgi:ribosomal protein S7
MDRFEHFMQQYFNMYVDFDLLDDYIYIFKYEQEKEIQVRLIKDLENIMENAKYDEARSIIHGCSRPFSKRLTEEFIRYLHARLKNKKPRLTLEELFKIR